MVARILPKTALPPPFLRGCADPTETANRAAIAERGVVGLATLDPPYASFPLHKSCLYARKQCFDLLAFYESWQELAEFIRRNGETATDRVQRFPSHE